jgi:hypothetical protein
MFCNIIFLKIFEYFSRYYYNIKNKLNNILFTEIYIKPHNNSNLTYIYYYYLLNYYFNNYIEFYMNKYLNITSNYNQIMLYEFSYYNNNMIRTSIINGTINNILKYTRSNDHNDQLKVFFKCNLIINGNKTNIRQLIRKYDTKTKLYDIIYYNYSYDINLNDVENNQIIIELGENKYNVKLFDKQITLEDT